MIRSITRFLSTSISSPEKSAGIFAFFTLCATILGIFRERLLATVIGPGPILDAYVAAHKIPDFLFATTASLVGAIILLPHLAKYTKSTEQHRFLSEVFTVFTIGTTLLSILLMIFLPTIMPFIAPGFDPETARISLSMSRIILLSPILMGISNILGAITQYKRQFIVASLAPVMYNLGTVIGINIGYDLLGHMALPIAILLGALLHMSIQLFVVVKNGINPRWVTGINWPRIRSLFSVALPRTFSASATTITALGVVTFGSLLTTGSVSIMNFAIIIQNVPVTLIGLSLSIGSYPVLVDLIAKGDRDGFSHRITQTLRIIFLLGFPIIGIGYAMRNHIVHILFGAGNFGVENIGITGSVTGILLIGLIAQAMILLGIRVYYAQNLTWRPLLQNAIGMVVTLALAGIGYLEFGLSLIWLAWSLVIGWTVNALIAWVHIQKHYLTRADYSSIFQAKIVALCAGLWGGITTYGCYVALDKLGVPYTPFGDILMTMIAGLMGALVIFWVYRLNNIHELSDAMRMIGYE